MVESEGANPQGSGTGRILTFHTGSLSLIIECKVKYFLFVLSASPQCRSRVRASSIVGGAQRPILRVIEPKKIGAKTLCSNIKIEPITTLSGRLVGTAV